MVQQGEVQPISEYSAAVQIDLQHALSRTIRNDLHALNPDMTYKVIRPKLDKDAMLAMMKERCRTQNMCVSGAVWNEELNKFLSWTCVNFFMHRLPKTFQTEVAWREHRVVCAGPVASTSRGRGRGRNAKSHPN